LTCLCRPSQEARVYSQPVGNLGARTGGWSVSRPGRFTTVKNTSRFVRVAEWASVPVWTGTEKYAFTGIRWPDDPVRSVSLYRYEEEYPCDGNRLDALFILCYYVNQPLHVSGMFVANHQEVYCIYTTDWYMMCFSVDCRLARSTYSQLKSTSRTSCCIYRVYLMMMGYKLARNV